MKKIIILLVPFIILCSVKKTNNKNALALIAGMTSSSNKTNVPEVSLNLGKGFHPAIKGVLAYKIIKETEVGNKTNLSIDENKFKSLRNRDSMREEVVRLGQGKYRLSYALYNGTNTLNAKFTPIGSSYIIDNTNETSYVNIKNPSLKSIISDNLEREKFMALISNIVKKGEKLHDGSTISNNDNNGYDYEIDEGDLSGSSIKDQIKNFEYFLTNETMSVNDLFDTDDDSGDFDNLFENILNESRAQELRDELEDIKREYQKIIKMSSSSKYSLNITSNISNTCDNTDPNKKSHCEKYSYMSAIQNQLDKKVQSESVDYATDFDKKVEQLGYLSQPNRISPPQSMGKVEPDTKKDLNNGTKVEVCTVKKYKAAPGYNEMSVMDPTTDVIWPGAIIKGETISNGKYAPITVPRKPIVISASLQNNALVRQTLENPSVSNFRVARNNIIAAGGNAPISASYTIEEVHSESQLGIALGANFSGDTGVYSGSIKSSFNFDKKEVKSRFIVKFIQKYYTIDIDIPNYPSSFFSDIPRINLNSWGVSPMYVSSVAYGRQILFTVESSENSASVKTALEASFKSVSVQGGGNLTSDQANTLKKSTTKVFILGGTSSSSAGANADISTPKGIKSIIDNGLTYNKSNPGAPISYKLRYLKDNSIGNIILSSEYNVRNCIISKTGKRVFKIELTEIYVGDVIQDGGDLEFDITTYFAQWNGSTPVKSSDFTRVYRAYRYPSIDIGRSEYLTGKEKVYTVQINNNDDLEKKGIRIDSDVYDWDASSANDLIQNRRDKFPFSYLLRHPTFSVRHSSSEGYVDMKYRFTDLTDTQP